MTSQLLLSPRLCL